MNKESEGNFHTAIGPFLILAQCFGIMPLNNVTSNNPLDLKFTWKSFKFFYAIFVTICMLFQTISTIIWTFSHRVEFDKIVPLVTFATNTIALCSFLKLGKKWPVLMQNWHTIENKLPTSNETQLIKKIKTISCVTLTVSLSKH